MLGNTADVGIKVSDWNIFLILASMQTSRSRRVPGRFTIVRQDPRRLPLRR